MENNSARAKQQVREFYERVGWNRAPGGAYADSAHAEDLRPVSDEYRHRCHLRVDRHLTKRPGLLLDVTSGPVQYPEYLVYSEGYSGRICADISYTALLEARNVLGAKSFYVQCDITALPFPQDALAGVVSLHTIYHVPADEQLRAFTEVQRVLRPGSTAVVVYSWGNHSLWMRLAGLPSRLTGLVRAGLRRVRRLVRREAKKTEPRLYFHVFDRAWFERNLRPQMDFTILPWRSLSVAYLKTYIHAWFFGKAFLRLAFWLEERWPVFLGKVGAHPMFILQKKA